ncbi:hypothetical protein ACFL52_03190 [Candidatus Margulisiibacteriota bacterium]
MNKDYRKLPYIIKDNFSLLFPDIKPASFDQNIKNWLKKGELIKLKRGLYILNDYFSNCNNKEDYLYFLSSLLCSPSYISRETVLSRYGILSEAVYGIASVTLKTTRSFNSKIAVFNFSKIKESLFTGFTENIFQGKKYYLATKAKAFFDYLYFAKRSLQQVNRKTVAELRLNLEPLSKNDWQEFDRYLRISKSEKIRRIYAVLRK